MRAPTHQVAITILAPVRAGEVEALRTALAPVGADPAANALIPFGRLAALHFARLVVVEGVEATGGSSYAPRLVLLLDADAPADDRLEELVDAAGEGLDTIFRHCEEYPAAPDRGARLSFLRDRQVSAAAIYVNTIGRTAEQVRQEASLQLAITEFLDRPGQAWRGKSAVEVRTAIRRFVVSEPSLQWARRRAPKPPLRWRIGEWLHIARSALLLLLALPIAIAVAPFAVILLRWRERTDRAQPLRATDDQVRLLASVEDMVAQNQFTAVGPLKPGRFRESVAVIVLWGVNLATRHYFNKGILSGVRTIHAARWVFLDGHQRLLFASNYDGSLESYMDDFIDKVAWGLNAVFSNGVDYPRTNWLIRDGAKDEQAFKNFIRYRQVETSAWYTAFPNLSTANIANNAQIRAGLLGTMDEAEAAAWLRRF